MRGLGVDMSFVGTPFSPLLTSRDEAEQTMVHEVRIQGSDQGWKYKFGVTILCLQSHGTE